MEGENEKLRGEKLDTLEKLREAETLGKEEGDEITTLKEENKKLSLDTVALKESMILISHTYHFFIYYYYKTLFCPYH